MFRLGCSFILLALFFAPTRPAAEGPAVNPPPAQASGSEAGNQTMQGVVKGVDTHNRSFSLLTAEGKTWKMAWNAQTCFFVAGHPVKANTVAPGQQAKVEYSVASGRMTAVKVILYPRKSSSTK